MQSHKRPVKAPGDRFPNIAELKCSKKSLHFCKTQTVPEWKSSDQLRLPEGRSSPLLDKAAISMPCSRDYSGPPPLLPPLQNTVTTLNHETSPNGIHQIPRELYPGHPVEVEISLEPMELLKTWPLIRRPGDGASMPASETDLCFRFNLEHYSEY